VVVVSQIQLAQAAAGIILVVATKTQQVSQKVATTLTLNVVTRQKESGDGRRVVIAKGWLKNFKVLILQLHISETDCWNGGTLQKVVAKNMQHSSGEDDAKSPTCPPAHAQHS
jgi:bifunctional N-acetylglucosamine-1-phosphate-uridyltransferase/glucosamine-1-phosphate-acetyltransferase GlmU-like protein